MLTSLPSIAESARALLRQLFVEDDRKGAPPIVRDQEVAFLKAEATQLRAALSMCQGRELLVAGSHDRDLYSTPAVNPSSPVHANHDKAAAHMVENAHKVCPVRSGDALQRHTQHHHDGSRDGQDTKKVRCQSTDAGNRGEAADLVRQLDALRNEYKDLHSLYHEATCIISQDKDAIAHLEKQVQILSEKEGETSEMSGEDGEDDRDDTLPIPRIRQQVHLEAENAMLTRRTEDCEGEESAVESVCSSAAGEVEACGFVMGTEAEMLRRQLAEIIVARSEEAAEHLAQIQELEFIIKGLQQELSEARLTLASSSSTAAEVGSIARAGEQGLAQTEYLEIIDNLHCRIESLSRRLVDDAGERQELLAATSSLHAVSATDMRLAEIIEASLGNRVEGGAGAGDGLEIASRTAR